MRTTTIALTLLLLTLAPLVSPASATSFACALPSSGVPTPRPFTIQVPGPAAAPSCGFPFLPVGNTSTTCPAPVLPIAVPLTDVLCGPAAPASTVVSCSSGPGAYNNLVVALDFNANGDIDPMDQVFYNTFSSALGQASIQFTAPGGVRYIATLAAGSGSVAIGCF